MVIRIGEAVNGPLVKMATKLKVLRFGAEEVRYSHFEDILKTQEKDEGTKVLWFVWIST